MSHERPEVQEEHPGVEGLLAAWSEALAAGDVDRMASIVTPEAEFWSPGQAPIRGREAVKAAFRPFFERYRMRQEFDRHELIVTGPWAFMRGLEVNRLTDRTSGEESCVRQRAFSLMQRGSDGAWRFHRGMTSQPPVETGEPTRDRADPR